MTACPTRRTVGAGKSPTVSPEAVTMDIGSPAVTIVVALLGAAAVFFIVWGLFGDQTPLPAEHVIADTPEAVPVPHEHDRPALEPDRSTSGH